MSDLLVRGLDEKTKQALVSRAARNGRSQQAEARSILEEALKEETQGWPAVLFGAARSVGGVELDLPERHAPRPVDVEGWR